MYTEIGDKVSFAIASGIRFPAIVISEQSEHDHTTRDGREIKITRVNVVSLRTTDPAKATEANPLRTYQQISSEVVDFGYAPKMAPRFTSLVGLDADENGALLPLQTVIDSALASADAFAAQQFSVRNGGTAAADL